MKINNQKQYKYFQNAGEHMEIITSWDSMKGLKTFSQRKNCFINAKSIGKLIIQLSYLIYFISCSKNSCYISKGLYITCSKTYEEEVRLILMSQNEWQSATSNILMKQYIMKNFVKLNNKSQTNLFDILVKQIDYILFQFKKYIGDLLMKKMGMGRINEIFTNFYLKPFEAAYQGIIKKNFDIILNVQSLVLTFEDTQLFRQYSLLVKYKNNSILSKLNNQPNCKQELLILTSRYEQIHNKLIKKKMIQYEYIQDNQQNIAIIKQLTEEFIKTLMKYYIVKLDYSMDDNQISSTKSKIIMNGDNKILGIQINKIKELSFTFTLQQQQLILLDRQKIKKNIKKNLNIEVTPIAKGLDTQFEINFDIIQNYVQVMLITSHFIQAQDEEVYTFLISSLSSIFENITYKLDGYRRGKNKQISQKKLIFCIKLNFYGKQNPFLFIIQMIDKLKIVQILTFYDIKFQLHNSFSNERKNRLKRQLQFLTSKMKQQIPIQFKKLKQS